MARLLSVGARSEADTRQIELHQFLDIFGRILLFAVASATLYGLSIITPKPWGHVLGFVGAMGIIAAAGFSTGGFGGFLFGAPKLSTATATPAGHLMANTNLEQVSDWLTKIIVGVTLVEFSKINDLLLMLRELLKNLDIPGLDVLGPIILIVFGVVGFLYIFMVTSTSMVFDQTAQERGDMVESLKANSDDVLSGKTHEPDAAAREAAKTVAKTPGASADEVGAAKVVLGDFKGAGESFLAFSRSTGDQASANAAVRSFALAGETTRAAEVRQEIKPPPRTRRSLAAWRAALSDMFSALYEDPPEGFTKALKIGTDLSKDSRADENSELWYYLAAAYGQQHKYLRKQKAPQAELVKARDDALKAMRKSLDISREYRRSFGMLLDPKSDDNDMSDFASDTDFTGLL